MKIAFFHFDFCGGPQKQNTDKILQGIKIAASCGADWVLTPEMALQGYHMVKNGTPYVLANRKNGAYDPLLRAAFHYNVNLFLGCAEQENEPHNSLTVIDSNGLFAGKHSKVKVVKWFTEDWAIPGDAFIIVNLDNVKAGLMVCADAWFGEHAELLKTKDAELIIVSAAWPAGDHGGPPREAWKRCSNCAGGIPVLISNQTGNRGMDCRKAESAVAQNGEILCTYHGPEAILLTEYDKEQKRIVSDSFEVIPFKYV